MNADAEKIQTPVDKQPTQQGQFKTIEELADHKYRDFMPKLKAALKNHPDFQFKIDEQEGDEPLNSAPAPSPAH